jgi:flagellar basal-body rod protein FlgB
MNIFAAAQSHMSWLGARQIVASENLANSDTPGFKSKEIGAFQLEMLSSPSRLQKTKSAHYQRGQSIIEKYGAEFQNNDEPTLSGNDVVIEKEIRVVGENARLYAFDVGLMKSFQKMVLASVRG